MYSYKSYNIFNSLLKMTILEIKIPLREVNFSFLNIGLNFQN